MSAPHTVQFTSVTASAVSQRSVWAQATASGVWVHAKCEGQNPAEVSVLLDGESANEFGTFVCTHSGSRRSVIEMEDYTDRVLALLKRMDTTEIIEAANVGEITTAIAYSALMERMHDSATAKTWMMAYRLGKRDGEDQ